MEEEEQAYFQLFGQSVSNDEEFKFRTISNRMTMDVPGLSDEIPKQTEQTEQTEQPKKKRRGRKKKQPQLVTETVATSKDKKEHDEIDFILNKFQTLEGADDNLFNDLLNDSFLNLFDDSKTTESTLSGQPETKKKKKRRKKSELQKTRNDSDILDEFSKKLDMIDLMDDEFKSKLLSQELNKPDTPIKKRRRRRVKKNPQNEEYAQSINPSGMDDIKEQFELIDLADEENALINQICEGKVAKFQETSAIKRDVLAALAKACQNKKLLSLVPTDTGVGFFTKSMIRSVIKPARRWEWKQFTIIGRHDKATFYHWQRVGDADCTSSQRFIKPLDIPSYSEEEYWAILYDPSWTKDETDHLFDLVKRFDLRFYMAADRWNLNIYPRRSIEDLKERYYSICSLLARHKLRPGLTQQMRTYYFDADHERARKAQLERLLNRTREEVEEELYLINEFKKINLRKEAEAKAEEELSNSELRKKKRYRYGGPGAHKRAARKRKRLRKSEDNKESSDMECKQTEESPSQISVVPSISRTRPMDIITPALLTSYLKDLSLASESSTNDGDTVEIPNLSISSSGYNVNILETKNLSTDEIPQPSPSCDEKFPSDATRSKAYDVVGIKTSKTFLRSEQMKLPSKLGSRRLRELEELLDELGIEQRPCPSEEGAKQFQELLKDCLEYLDFKHVVKKKENEAEITKRRYIEKQDYQLYQPSTSTGGYTHVPPKRKTYSSSDSDY